MSDVQYNLDILRGEVAELRAMVEELRDGRSEDSDPNSINLKTNLEKSLQKAGRSSGFAVANLTAQVRVGGHSGTAFGIYTLEKPADLPSDEEIEAKVARLALFTQSPIYLKVLKFLAEPCFDGEPMARTKSELMVRLKFRAPADCDKALKPLLAAGILRRGRTDGGSETYEWDGNGLAMMLLITA